MKKRIGVSQKNDMTASTLVSSIIIVIKIVNWKRKYKLANHSVSRFTPSYFQLKVGVPSK